jgi:hypothetical protein
MEIMQTNLNDMLKKLDQAKQDNTKMAEVVRHFSQRVQGAFMQ